MPCVRKKPTERARPRIVLSALSQHGRPPSEALLRNLMAAVDADGSGDVDRHEFENVLRAAAAATPSAQS
jgi:Ca2+-binding EF-hand superfamily protein